jgi:hypothetical protein
MELTGIAGMLVVVAGLFLGILTLLMPVYVYLAATYARQCRDELRKLREAICAKKASRDK